MYKCRECKKQFTPTSYQRKKHDWLCQPCRRRNDLEWRKKRKAMGFKTGGGKMSKEYHREYGKKYFKNPINQKRRNALAKKYRENPLLRMRHEARWQTNKAIKSGRLIKKPCEVCQNQNSEAHHDNYYKPLEVRWLCRQHHREFHSKAEGRG